MKIHLVFIILLLFNCSSDNSADDSRSIFVVNDFTINIDENPSQGQLIGTIPYEVYEDLYTVILSQNVSDAIYIVEDEIHVKDPILFDYETNPSIIANVKVERGSYYNFVWYDVETKSISITINLNDIPD